MGCSAANAGRSKPPIHDIKMGRNVCFISFLVVIPKFMVFISVFSSIRIYCRCACSEYEIHAEFS